MPVSALVRGRDAYGRRAWDDAFRELEAADRREALGAEDLERFAWSAALSGRDDELLVLMERTHNEWLAAGNCQRAVRAAFWLGMRLATTGHPAQGGGWIARCERLLEGHAQPCAESGYVLLARAQGQLAAGDTEAVEALAASARALGVRFEDLDLVALATSLQGQALVKRGDTNRGFALLDEAMVDVAGGSLSPIVTGVLYCSLISSCRRIFALERAREWTAALSRWWEGQPQLVAFTGACLVYRAEILQLAGDWPDALDEARRAADRVRRSLERDTAALACYQQGEIHRLRGEFPAAELAYRAASGFGLEPQPGLALLRLSQGQKDAAATAVRRVLGGTRDSIARLRLLPAGAEIMIACDALDEARGACAELEAAAARLRMDVLSAMAGYARGALCLAEGDAAAALPPLRTAFDIWRAVGAPYIAARARVLIARACDVLGDRDGATLERTAARAVFEELGARPDLDQLDRQHSSQPPDSGPALTPRERQVLRLVAAGKTNKAIAAELTLSEKTVDRHVSNIFVKIDVPSRAAATAYAYQHKLV
jgi:DNA-binding CsgD family transcriptional regulator